MIDLLDESRLKAGLHESCDHHYHLELFDSLPSTNKYLVESAAEHKPGISNICIAAKQTAGVGRRGRTWHSGSSSITLSIRHRFERSASELGGLSLAIGIVAAEVLEKNGVESVQLKWPNDLMVQDRKLAGILIELPSTGKDFSIAVAGIGINYAPDPEHSVVDQPLTTLSESSATLGTREQVAAEVAAAMVNACCVFDKSGWSDFAEHYDARNYLLGKSVTITQGEDTGVAKVLGIGESGGLVVETDGVTRTLFGGEVSVRVVL